MTNIKNLLTLFLGLFFTIQFANAQIFKTKTGALENLTGVKQYNLIFEYADDIKIPKHPSEEAFIASYSTKKNEKELESGDSFSKAWYANREALFEPKFIQEFNFFNLKEKQVTVAKNRKEAAYTMIIKTYLIDMGNSNFFFKNNAQIEVTISIVKSDSLEEVVYETEIVDVHSKGASTGDFDRVMSAYAELGRGLSKHLSRKTLN